MDTIITLFDHMKWLLHKKHGKCPRCNSPVVGENKKCPYCRQPLDWSKF